MRRILTYGTFDLLHYGHIRILKRARELGDYLIVAVSTDEFNAIKGKKAYHNFETRKKMLEAVRYVDLVIPEYDWEQKRDDVKKYFVDAVVMGSDWKGNEKFENLRDLCDVIYLPRTRGISTTQIKHDLGLPKIQEPIVESVTDVKMSDLNLPKIAIPEEQEAKRLLNKIKTAE
jgi:glycerol-3-phosphate cytidylyltransferase